MYNIGYRIVCRKAGWAGRLVTKEKPNTPATSAYHVVHSTAYSVVYSAVYSILNITV